MIETERRESHGSSSVMESSRKQPPNPRYSSVPADEEDEEDLPLLLHARRSLSIASQPSFKYEQQRLQLQTAGPEMLKECKRYSLRCG